MEWDKIQAVWQPVSGPLVIQEDRFSGKLHVEAGGKTFDAVLDKDGKYTFANR
jgi:hypothetical protein